MRWQRTAGLLAPAAAWMLLIYVVSAQSTLPVLDVGWMDRAVKAASHAGEYAVLATLMARWPLRNRARLDRRSALGIACLCTVYALTDEYHQMLVPGRVADWADVAADAIGAGAAVLLLSRDRPARLLKWVDPLL